ncbi:hypothetical protein QWY31_15535 [Cytophagales bacterium LB-30]|uniref:O-antigen translocase n=1 Tax=Shiella aurantiaca TaxID=3058365 RepID=A0ABT8F9G1_9BACT|nr:hypothetical protein [Shiella aurantiaca]MDN4166923.1 hypothetical protein [Shiella aurantiaca]
MGFIKDSLETSLGVAAKVIGSLFLNKVFALFFGAAGISLITHVQNYLSILVQIPMDGVNRGFIRNFSHLPDREQKTALLGNSFWLSLLILLLTWGLYAVLFPNWTEVFGIQIHSLGFQLLLLAAVVGMILQALLLSVLQARQQFMRHSYGQLLLALVQMLFLGGSLYFGGVQKAIEAFLWSHISGGLLLVFIAVVQYRKQIVWSKLWSVNYSRPLSGFIWMALSVLLFGKTIDFLVRAFSIDRFGAEPTGLWQSVVRLSDMYIMLFISVVGSVFYPGVSRLIFDFEALKKYIREVFKVLIPVLLVFFLVLYGMGEWLLRLFYTRDFISAKVFMPYQFIGDFLAMCSFLLAYVLSAQARTITFIAIQAFSAGIYMLCIYVFLSEWGIMSFAMAHMVRYMLFFLLLVYLNRKLLN